MGLAMINLADLVRDTAAIFRPPERLSVAQAAEKYVQLNNPPSYVGPYLNDKAPYMVEPMDMTMSRDHTALIFAGPAQSAKTQALVLNLLAYVVKCNPMDAILYSMSQSAARDFSKRRVDRLHRYSEEVGSELLKGQHADNTHDKTYKSGMLFSISWPAINEMSSKPVPIVIFTDYDRMPDDIDGEGSPFVLGQKRTTTFRNLGMTIVETSPGRPVKDSKYRTTGHEAPPCTGVLSLYNQGDRRRWYWPCPECNEFFEPAFSLLTWKTTREVDSQKIPLTIPEMAETTRMQCPHCGEKIEHRHKKAMNRRGVWLREGEKIRVNGERYGSPRYSKTVSYWLKGPAATFITWPEMVTKYLNAMQLYEQTGDDTELKATINTDQAEPYTPKTTESARMADDLQARAVKDRDDRVVPEDVRCLFAMIDVQKNRWEVQVHGVRPGRPYDLIVIDRFKVEKSKRLDADGDPLWVKPASYPEDWDLLIEQVMDKTYPLEDGKGRMSIALTLCDSGGSKSRNHDKKSSELEQDMSTTSNAYNFWRSLREKGRADRFVLVKGDPNMSAPRAHLEYPDSSRKDRNAGARGEIPVLFLNVNSLKDTLNAMLDREEPGGGMVEYPAWLPHWWYEELVAEARTNKGWVKLGSRRNEAWDLLTYAVGACVWRRIEKVDWANPPPWLAPWAQNPHVTLEGPQAPSVDKSKSPTHLLERLGEELA